jgi:hypothetical protein
VAKISSGGAKKSGWLGENTALHIARDKTVNVCSKTQLKNSNFIVSRKWNGYLRFLFQEIEKVIAKSWSSILWRLILSAPLQSDQPTTTTCLCALFECSNSRIETLRRERATREQQQSLRGRGESETSQPGKGKG